MAKKEIKQMEVTETEIKSAEVIKRSEVTHHAYSMVANADESFSVIKIGFNPVDNYVEPKVEIIETNTDKYIIQERLSILLLEMEIS